MIDTIVITLNRSDFSISDHKRFTPSTESLFNDQNDFGARSYVSCVQNPTKDEYKRGIIKPKLTVTKRIYNYKYQTMMKVEFSAPKLIFKNNFDELNDNCLEKVIHTLQERLKEMGVIVSEYTLADAQVSSIHCSKNILLTDGLTPISILKEIKKANITQRLDFNQSDFRNEGHSLKYRTNTYEVIFYDKIKDLQKARISDKRAIEDDNQTQIGLFDELDNLRRKRPLEVIRVEVRLNTRMKINQIIRKVGKSFKPTLANLFKEDISKAILLHFINQIEESSPKTIYVKTTSAMDFISQFIIDNPKIKLKNAIQAYGYHKALEETGTREVRSLLKQFPISSWYRFNKEMNSYSYSKRKAPYIDLIKDSIINYTPLRLVDFKDKMLNNDKYN